MRGLSNKLWNKDPVSKQPGWRIKSVRVPWLKEGDLVGEDSELTSFFLGVIFYFLSCEFQINEIGELVPKSYQ